MPYESQPESSELKCPITVAGLRLRARGTAAVGNRENRTWTCKQQVPGGGPSGLVKEIRSSVDSGAPSAAGIDAATQR